MKNFNNQHLIIVLLALAAILPLASCNTNRGETSQKHVSQNWNERTIVFSSSDSLIFGESYLSVYSEIYSYTAEQTFPLTATVSIHNTSQSDSIFIKKADYYNTNGKLIRSYVDQPIFVKPLESLQIVIDETDEEGGTGANFIFEWATPSPSIEPYFEAVMISTSGQQGMSFTTRGVKTSG